MKELKPLKQQRGVLKAKMTVLTREVRKQISHADFLKFRNEHAEGVRRMTRIADLVARTNAVLDEKSAQEARDVAFHQARDDFIGRLAGADQGLAAALVPLCERLKGAQSRNDQREISELEP